MLELVVDSGVMMRDKRKLLHHGWDQCAPRSNVVIVRELLNRASRACQETGNAKRGVRYGRIVNPQAEPCERTAGPADDTINVGRDLDNSLPIHEDPVDNVVRRTFRGGVQMKGGTVVSAEAARCAEPDLSCRFHAEGTYGAPPEAVPDRADPEGVPMGGEGCWDTREKSKSAKKQRRCTVLRTSLLKTSAARLRAARCMDPDSSRAMIPQSGLADVARFPYLPGAYERI